MLTYQDLLQVNENDEAARMAFVRSVITDHKNSELYKTAVAANEYDHKRNATIMRYEKTLRTLTGREIPDKWSPNHKTTRNFFNYFTSQQNQYLLGNGVSWNVDDSIISSKFGEDFDTKLQTAGKKALVQGESFGFYNLDHVEIFEILEFAPLYDEENGSLRSGIRFWQINEQKPLRATLYEEDGYTSYIWNERDAQGKIDEGGRVYEPKRPYVIKTRTTEIDGTEIYDGMNYPAFPIIPLWANPNHQSELVGIQEQIDSYDFIKNSNINDNDTAQLYWVIKGAGGMDDPDLAQFMQRIKQNHFASLEDGQEVQPVEVNVPYASREETLNRLERDLYKDYGALNIEEIKGGAITATQIIAAYEPVNQKADLYEFCIIQFIKGLCDVAGIKAKPTFTRSKLVNVSEEIQTVLSAQEDLDDEYTTKKILTLLGDADQFDEVQKRKAADELERGGVMADEEGNLGNGIDTEEAIDDAEEAAGVALNGIQTQSMIAIISQYTQGTLNENQAANLIAASIGISKEKARDIVLGN